MLVASTLHAELRQIPNERKSQRNRHFWISKAHDPVEQATKQQENDRMVRLTSQQSAQSAVQSCRQAQAVENSRICEQWALLSYGSVRTCWRRLPCTRPRLFHRHVLDFPRIVGCYFISSGRVEFQNVDDRLYGTKEVEDTPINSPLQSYCSDTKLIASWLYVSL